MLVTCSRDEKNAAIMLTTLLITDNLLPLLSSKDPQVLSNFGEVIGNVFGSTSVLVPQALSRTAISLIVDLIKNTLSDMEMERCVLGILLKLLCRADVARHFVTDHFSLLLELASSSPFCKPMVPIVLAQLFGLFEEDQTIQDASLLYVSRAVVE